MAIQKILGTIKAAEDKKRERLYRNLESHGNGNHAAAHDESNWLVSYADMMTLLCCFFILLFSMSKVEEAKYEKMKEEVSKHFGGQYIKPPEPPSQELARSTQKILEDLGVQKEAKVQKEAYGLSVSFQSTFFFDTLSAEVKPEGRAVLDKVMDAIAKTQSSDQMKFKIVVEGHTDNRPILDGIYPSNWELSGARAARVVRLFLEKGFAPESLAAIGYADTRPEAPSRLPTGEWDEAGLAKNRRVVLRVLEPPGENIPLPMATALREAASSAREPASAAAPAESAAPVTEVPVAAATATAPTATSPTSNPVARAQAAQVPAATATPVVAAPAAALAAEPAAAAPAATPTAPPPSTPAPAIPTTAPVSAAPAQVSAPAH